MTTRSYSIGALCLAHFEFDFVARVDPYALHFGIGIESRCTHLLAHAALGVAAERQRVTEDPVVVHPDGAGADAMKHAVRPSEICCPDARRESVARAVRDPHRLVLVIETDQRGDRAEDLLACDTALRRNVPIDGGWHEVTLPRKALTTAEAAQPFLA